MISRALSSPLRVLDIFAGSGCIGIAVLKHVPAARVDFAEKEKKFCEQIERNAKLNGVGEGRYRIAQSDIFSHVNGTYDYILANPPYIPEGRKELVQQSVIDNNGPHDTIFGGEDGLRYTKPFLVQARRHLKSGGVIYLEFDSPEQKKIERFSKALGYSQTECQKDQYGKWRFARLVF